MPHFINWSGGPIPLDEALTKYLERYIEAYGEPNVRVHVAFNVYVNEKDIGWTLRGMTGNAILTPTVAKKMKLG